MNRARIFGRGLTRYRTDVSGANITKRALRFIINAVTARDQSFFMVTFITPLHNAIDNDT